MASLFIKTIAALNIETARALAREVEGEGRSAPPKEMVETAPKSVKNVVSNDDAVAAPKGEVRWANFAHKQAGSILVPQNQGTIGRWTGPDGWAWMRVAEAHDWAKAKEKAAKDGRWWVCLEGGKLWGWSPPNARPSLGEKSPEVSKETTSPVTPATEPAKEENPISPVGEALGKLPARSKRTKKASSKEVEDKKE